MNMVCGLVDYSLGVGNGAGKTNVKLSETQNSGKNAYLFPTGWVSLAVRPHLPV